MEPSTKEGFSILDAGSECILVEFRNYYLLNQLKKMIPKNQN